MSKQVSQGTTALLYFSTKDANRQLVDADALPTIRSIQVNGSDTTVAGAAIAQVQDNTPANIVGEYVVNIPTTALAAGDQVEVLFSATIAGATRTEACSFSIVSASAGSSSYIDVNC